MSPHILVVDLVLWLLQQTSSAQEYLVIKSRVVGLEYGNHIRCHISPSIQALDLLQHRCELPIVFSGHRTISPVLIRTAGLASVQRPTTT